MAGHKCIGYSEIDKFALKSYRAIFNTEGEWYEKDIREIKAENIPGCDLWTFGFPCQDISIAGNRKGLNGERSRLFYTIINLIKGQNSEVKPRWLLIENVKNLISINGGRDFTEVLHTLSEAGYDAQWQVINSKDYGVAQSRERLYTIGYLRGEPRQQILPIKPKSTEHFKGIIERDKNFSVRPCSNPKQSNRRQKGRRAKSEKEPAFTITASKVNGIIINNNKVRTFTPKECFRLQGFPDKVFEKARKVNSDAQLYKQIGNSVTVNVIYEIGKKLKSTIS